MSLEPLSVPEATGAELVSVGAAAGFDLVSMFAYSPTSDLTADPAVSDMQARAAMKARMAETGVGLLNLECFNLTPEEEPANFAEALACGADLGARHATAIVWENGDRADALRKFRRLCDMAAEHAIRVNLEFFASCRSVPDVQTAAGFVREAGRTNAGLVLDMLHIVRTSGGMAGLAGIGPDLVGTVQINDGPSDPSGIDPHAETLERGLPGTGDFPLDQFLDWLPPEVVVGVEVPQFSLFGKTPPLERAQRMAEAARGVLADQPVH